MSGLPPAQQSRATLHCMRPQSSTQVHSPRLTLARYLDLHDGEGDPFPMMARSGLPQSPQPCYSWGVSGTSLLTQAYQQLLLLPVFQKS